MIVAWYAHGPGICRRHERRAAVCRRSGAGAVSPTARTVTLTVTLTVTPTAAVITTAAAAAVATSLTAAVMVTAAPPAVPALTYC